MDGTTREVVYRTVQMTSSDESEDAEYKCVHKWRVKAFSFIDKWPTVSVIVAALPQILLFLLLLVFPPGGKIENLLQPQVRPSEIFRSFHVDGHDITRRDAGDDAARYFLKELDDIKARRRGQDVDSRLCHDSASHWFDTGIFYLPKEGLEGDTNLLQNHIIEELRLAESTLRQQFLHSGFSDVCYREEDCSCAPFLSPINVVYSSWVGGRWVPDGEGSFADATNGNLTEFLSILVDKNLPFFDRRFSELDPRSQILLSNVRFRSGVDSELIQSFIANAEILVDRLEMTHARALLGLLDRQNEFLLTKEVGKTVTRDVTFAVASLGFVMLYTWMNTSSIFLAVMSIVNIALGFSFLFFFHNGYSAKDLNLLNLLSIFIMLAIGTDDVFVLTGVYSQAKWYYSDGSEISSATRLAWTHRKAGNAMFITSFTTAVAFFSNVLSAIPGIRDFGFFVGGVVIVNYLTVVTWFPCCVAFWSQYLTKSTIGGRCLTFLCRRKVNVFDLPALDSSSRKAVVRAIQDSALATNSIEVEDGEGNSLLGKVRSKYRAFGKDNPMRVPIQLD